MQSTKFFITLTLIAAIHIPWPTFGQEPQEGALSKFAGQPDVVEVDDLNGDKMVIEANGTSVFVNIFSSLSSQERAAPTKRENPQ